MSRPLSDSQRSENCQAQLDADHRYTKAIEQQGVAAHRRAPVQLSALGTVAVRFRCECPAEDTWEPHAKYCPARGGAW